MVVLVYIVNAATAFSAAIVVVCAAVAVIVALLMMLLLFLLRDAVVALDGFACTNVRKMCVLGLSVGQCTCACVCFS